MIIHIWNEIAIIAKIMNDSDKGDIMQYESQICVFMMINWYP